MMYPLEVINSYLFAPCIEALKPTGGKLWYGYKSNCAIGSKRWSFDRDTESIVIVIKYEMLGFNRYKIKSSLKINRFSMNKLNN